jgi:hypothetical protein
MKTLRSLVFVFLLLTLSRMALAGEMVYSAEPYSHDGITVNAQQIFLKKGKIWFKLLVINGTDKLLMIDKNQIMCRLPDGRTLAREVSVFAGHGTPHEVAPGLSHPLYVEYKIGDLPLQAKLQFDHGFILGGKPIVLPEYVASPLGSR